MKMKKIALVLLPVFSPGMPPLSLALLRSFLDSNNITADTLDFNNFFFSLASSDMQRSWKRSCNVYLEDNFLDIARQTHRDEFRSMINALLNYDIVGFSCYKSNFNTTLKISRMLKKEDKSIKIIWGGPEIARQFFKEGEVIKERYDGIADLLVVGEGELPLLRYLTDGLNSGGLVTFCELENSDCLFPPDYSGFQLDSYPRKSSIPLIISRGCVRKCVFCTERLLFKRYRGYRSCRVIEFMREYKEKGFKQFIFNDSLINGSLSDLEDLCDGIMEEFGSVKWEAQIAVRSDMKPGLFEKMKESGCYHLFVGLESGCEATLKKMNKGFSREEALDFFRELSRIGLSFGISLITGFPGETEEEFRQSLDFVVENKDVIPKIEQVNPFVYYDGIPLQATAGCRIEPVSLKRARVFIEEIKEAGFKYTNAFMLNLLEH